MCTGFFSILDRVDQYRLNLSAIINTVYKMFENEHIICNDSIVSNSSIPKDIVTQVYEVVRMIDGVPIFFNEHYERFLNSCRLAGVSYYHSKEQLAIMLYELAQKEKVFDKNVKYMLNIYPDRAVFYGGFIKSNYPSGSMYSKGVSVGTLYEERQNPQAKILNQLLRSRADEQMQRYELFEVALVNRENRITEGSRSNLFFIDAQNIVHTASLKDVLGGVTREVVIEEIRKDGIALVESSVRVEDISCMQSGFISGTSPSVLPIAKFDNKRFEVGHKYLKRISTLYDNRVKEDIAQFKELYV